MSQIFQITAEFDESLVDLLAKSSMTGLSIHRNGKPVMCVELGTTYIDAAKCVCNGFQVGERTILDLPQDYAKDYTAKMLVRSKTSSAGRFAAVFPKRLEIATLDVSVAVNSSWTFTIKNGHYTVKCGDALEERSEEM